MAYKIVLMEKEQVYWGPYDTLDKAIDGLKEWTGCDKFSYDNHMLPFVTRKSDLTGDCVKYKIVEIDMRETTKDEVDAFMNDIAEVCKRHGMTIAGCGCCGSPYINTAAEGTIAKDIFISEVDFSYNYEYLGGN